MEARFDFAKVAPGVYHAMIRLENCLQPAKRELKEMKRGA